MSQPATFNLADLWEAVVPRVAEREALTIVDPDDPSDTRRLTYAQIDERANRLAHWMAAQGVTAGDHVAVHLTNCSEYLETMLAAYKLRAVAINVNHRYVAAELRYVLDDADVVGVVHHRRFAPLLAGVRDQLPGIGWYLAVDDGSDADLDPLGPGPERPAGEAGMSGVTGPERPAGEAGMSGVTADYESELAGHSPEADFDPRSGEDPYVIYTGGTTGLPKGVVWRQEDAFFACVGGGDPMRLMGPVDEPSQVLDRIVDGTFVYFPVAPLMHAAGQWTALSWLLAGGRVVLMRGSLDPVGVWRTVEQEKVNLLTVVGDPVVRPLLDAWDAEGPFDVSSLLSIGSGGAALSPVHKERLMELLPNVGLVDGFGSSETGAQGSQRLEPGSSFGGVTQFTPYGETTTVLDETTRRPVAPGSEVIGRVARRGRIPLGYHNDPERTAATFVEVEGDRWVLTGDMATVDADGTVRLLGRGSQCINTGGEKVYPEEVEGVLKAHPSVYDAIVVGVDDQRWGQRVAAVVQPVEGHTPTLDELSAHCREHLAGYKVPRTLVVVPHVERSPAGKADYRWASSVAETG